MSTRQSTVVWLVGALLFGMFFRLGEDRARAAPVPCTRWACISTWAWWPGNIGTQSFSA
jgi:hypothetical protein